MLPPTLQNLADQLVAREPCRHGIERRTAPAAFAAQGVAIAALFGLKYDRAGPFEGRAAFEQFRGNRRAAPRIHDGRPRSVSGELSERRQRDR